MRGSGPGDGGGVMNGSKRTSSSDSRAILTSTPAMSRSRCRTASSSSRGPSTRARSVGAPKTSRGCAAGVGVVGVRVVWCGACRACRIGASYLCQRLKVRGVDVTGGMQEYWVVPAAQMLHVPHTLSDDQAAVLEPLAVATHDVDRA